VVPERASAAARGSPADRGQREGDAQTSLRCGRVASRLVEWAGAPQWRAPPPAPVDSEGDAQALARLTAVPHLTDAHNSPDARPRPIWPRGPPGRVRGPRVGHPMQRSSVGMTVNWPEPARGWSAEQGADDLGQQHLGVPLPHSPTSWHREDVAHGGGEAPQVHRHEHVAVEGGRLRPSPAAKDPAPRPPRCAALRSHERAWSLSAHTPRVTGLSPMTALRSRKPTRHCRPDAAESLGRGGWAARP